MPKTQGFKVKIMAFVPIARTDFGKQAAAYAMMDGIKKSKQLPPDFLSSAFILDVDAKPGGVDLPEQSASAEGSTGTDDPANTPLTTDALPEGATVLDQSDALDGSIIQTVRLADGTETMRRISADQAAAEDEASAPSEMVGDKVTKRGGKAAT